MKKIVFCLSLLMFITPVVRTAEADELMRIRQNYVRSLLPSGGEQEDLVRYLQQIIPESEMSDQVVIIRSIKSDPLRIELLVYRKACLFELVV